MRSQGTTLSAREIASNARRSAIVLARMPLAQVELTDFLLEGSLGSGASSQVYHARHRPSGRPVAIKRLAGSRQPHDLRERFAREARMLASIDSPHVVRVHGFGFDEGRPFLVLERLEGETLDVRLRRHGRIPLETAGPWVEQIITGIRHCHDANVIHRDLKPSNLFLAKAGQEEILKLIDFGVARPRERSGDFDPLTATNDVIGSVGYMAPEQFKDAKHVTTAIDIYAIGIITFKLLTGRLPFGPTTLQTLELVQRDVPQVSTVSGRAEHAVVDDFLRCALSPRPEDRFPTARAMLEAWWRVMASLDRYKSSPALNPFADDDDITIRQSSPSLTPEPHAPHTIEPFFLEDDPTLDDPDLPRRVDAERLAHANRLKKDG
jgi:serine/threonine protein kinase